MPVLVPLLAATLVATAATAVAGCSLENLGSGESGSGRAASDQRTIASFDTVHLDGETDLEVKIGPTTSLTVLGDDNLLDGVSTDVEDRTLSVDTSHNPDPVRPLVVRVTTPTLGSLRADGRGTVRLHGLRGGQLNITVDGYRKVITEGRVDRLRVDADGFSRVITENLPAGNVEAHTDGFSSVES